MDHASIPGGSPRVAGLDLVMPAEDFQALPSGEKASLLCAMVAMPSSVRPAFHAEWTRSAEDRVVLLGVVESAGFRVLPPATQRGVLESLGGVPASTRTILAEQLAKLGHTPKGAETVGRLFSAPGFQGLPVADGERLLRYVGGINHEVSKPARRELRKQLQRPAFVGGTPSTQQRILESFLQTQPGIEDVVDVPVFALARGSPVSVGEPTAVRKVPFNSKEGPGKRYDAQVDDRTISIYIADAKPQPRLYMHSIDDVVEALSRMAPEARAMINEIHVDAGRSKSDEYWAKKFGHPEFRAYMTADSARGVLTVHPSPEPNTPHFMAGSFMHEAGHFDSIARWGNSPNSDDDWRDWRVAQVTDRLAVSDYAKYSTSEDFAETYHLYFQVRGTVVEDELRQIFPERFAILDRLYGSSP